MKDWTNLQDKINRGEALTTRESKRYLELREMFENEDFKAKSKNSEYAFDENEIAKSLNMINVLAAKGEILGAETEEMGKLLADYTSKNNFKTTRTEVKQTLGFFASFIAMVKFKIKLSIPQAAIKTKQMLQQMMLHKLLIQNKTMLQKIQTKKLLIQKLHKKLLTQKQKLLTVQKVQKLLQMLLMPKQKTKRQMLTIQLIQQKQLIIKHKQITAKVKITMKKNSL